MASKGSYGSNPHSARNPNANLDWGNYQWPGGVPSSLLATATYQGKKSRNVITVRKELITLCLLSLKLAEVKHGYPVYGSPNPSGEPTWGPWTYENRAIGGTSSPSNHSKGKAMDWNAPRNSMSTSWHCDMPPALVRDMESCGFYWGGRYSGRTDPMHFEYCFNKTDVATHLARMQRLLGVTPPAKPAPKPPAKPSTGTGIPKAKKTATYNPSGTKPSFPLPKGHTFGVITGPATQHSGDPKHDSATIRKNIRTIQSYLNAIGWYTAAIDGLFGNTTASVVKRFQKAYTGPTGKLTVDGIVGSRTWNAMGLRV